MRARMPPALRRLGALVALLLTGGGAAAALFSARETGTAGETLNITAFRETFSEDFRAPLDVTPWGPSRWIAHTPWHGDFGDAAFADPQPGFPFQTGADGLRIIARKNADGKWQAGLLSSVDAQNRGFSQAGGYFEIRMKMPPGPGVWPAFWLTSHADPDYAAEIDVIEYYGVGPGAYMTNLNLWPKSKSVSGESHQVRIDVPEGSLAQAFHTYGAEIRNDVIVYYLDRHEVRRLPTPRAAKAPMSILIDLALGSGWPIDQTPNPSVLQVDYVKAFVRKP